MTAKDEIPAITKGTGDNGDDVYHFWADGSWEGFDTLIEYIKKHWNGQVFQLSDDVYSRTAVLKVHEGSIFLKHDSQLGNLFSPGDLKSRVIAENIFHDIGSRFI